jgi:cytochrome P450
MARTGVFDQILNYANRADPYPLYAELRRTPVMRREDGGYVVSTYREIIALLHDPRISSIQRPERGDGLAPGFIGRDPPDHDRLRRLAMRHFGPPEAPGRVEGLRGRVAGITTALVDDFQGRHQVDVVDDFAYPLPVMVICELLGVPPEDEPRFHAWSEKLIEVLDPRMTEEQEALRNAALREVRAYLNELTEAHLRRPGDDLISALATGDGEDRMSREELLSTASLLLVAGHETTVNLIGNGMLTLLRHPDILGRLRREPDLIVRVVEELLRYEPPVHFLPQRTALADIDIAGTTIPEGAHITLAIAAGSRDPGRFDDPDRFDPDRRDNEHLGFGSGIHYCFGAPLARLETQIALSELACRLENPRLVTDPPPYRRNPSLRGPRHLLVEFDAVI